MIDIVEWFAIAGILEVGWTYDEFYNDGNKRIYCERRELPSQSYGTPKKRNKILNIGLRTILYKTFSYSFSILN